MINKPTLFVNSIIYKINSNGNQVIFDSRNNPKDKISHRLDDVRSFLIIGRNVYLKIRCKTNVYEGYALYLDNKCINIKNNSISIAIFTKDIDEIKIISVS